MTSQLVTVKLEHRSSIPNARWCKAIGWEPVNQIDGAELLDGSWWSETEEEAGLVCFVEGDEGDEIDVALDDLRVASCGDCRVIASVEVQ